MADDSTDNGGSELSGDGLSPDECGLPEPPIGEEFAQPEWIPLPISRGRLVLWAVGALAVALVVACMLFVPLALFIVPDPFDLEDPLLLLLGAGATGAGLSVVAAVCARLLARAGRTLPAFFGAPTGRAVKTGLAIGLLCVGISAIWDVVIATILGHRPPSPWDILDAGRVEVVAVCLSVGCVVAPIAEEVFFRGFLLGMFQREGYVGLGVVVSALLFTVGHVADLYNLPIILAYGLVLAVLYRRTGSLAAPISAHVLNNTISFSLALFGPG